ncbi:MAG TPA: hypothetical protein VH867_03095, partial [Burkholderiales bacterium]
MKFSWLSSKSEAPAFALIEGLNIEVPSGRRMTLCPRIERPEAWRVVERRLRPLQRAKLTRYAARVRVDYFFIRSLTGS